MDINELQSFKLSDAVKFHDELNPKLWTVDDKLLPEVQEQLEKIAEDFLMSLGISDLKVKDITISGSNAAYSYTPYSDLDLHIVVDFNELPDDEVYKELFNAKKTVYNDTHDIKINDIPVELYVQDANQKHTSLGEYSVKNKDWVKFPIKRRANLDQKETRLKYEKLGNLVELAIKLKDVERINQVLSTLKRYRRAGLNKTGEFGPENLAYKLIRTQGLLQALIDTKNEIHSKNLSLPENNVLEVIDLPKKKYQVTNNRYHTGEVHFTTKTGNEYTVSFRPDVYIDRPEIAKHYPKFIDNHTSGKEVYFDIKDGYDHLPKGKQQGVPLTGTGDEFEVFSTVSDVIHHYLRTKKPVYLVFAADEKRESLYRKIAKKISQDFDTFKLIKIPYKKSADVYLVYNTKYTSDNVYEAIDLKKLVSDPKKLKTYDTHISPKEAYTRLMKGQKDKYLVRALAKDPEFAYDYATYVLEGPFPLGEPAIAKHAGYAYQYARYILKGPFPLGEPAIAKEPVYAYYYAESVLQGPFPLGEPAIATNDYWKRRYQKQVLVLKGRPWTGLDQKVDEAIDLKNLVTDPTKLKTYDTHISPQEAYTRLKKGDKDPILVKVVAKDPMFAFRYARNVLDGPFTLGEPEIAKYSAYSFWYANEVLYGPFKLGEPAIAKSPDNAYYYARDVLHGPFPLGEPAIAKDPGYAYHYARYVLKGPFLLGEPEIATDDYWKPIYQEQVLKGRPWTGLKKKTTEALDLKKLVTHPKKLKTYHTHVSAEEAYTRLKNGDKDPILVKVVAKDPMYAYWYARQVLKGPFKLGEPIIAKDPSYAYYYAVDILKGPFPLGEPTIAKDPGYAYYYAKDVLKGPFPLGEPAIAKTASRAYSYAIEVLKGPFPLGEPEIAKDPEWAYEYASDVLKGPFPLSEPTIAKHPYVSLGYARNVLKGPFPLAEPVIMQYSSVAEAYENYILKGKPWTGLKKKTTEAIDLKKLVTHPKKLKTHDTHISPKEAYSKLKKGKTDEYLVRAVAKSPKYAGYYAQDILKSPFPLGEPAIAKDSDAAYWYARYVLQGPFPLGEPAIAKGSDAAYWYARYVLQGPFPLGEPEIARTAGRAYSYARNVLDGPFTLGEPAISKEPYYAYHYAKDILKGPFPLGEPTIYQDRYYQNGYYKSEYETDVLKGRPWTGLDLKKKTTEALDLKNLVTHPKKLKTHDTHISPQEAYERLKNGDKDPILVKAVAKSSAYAYGYARDVLNGPFPLGEPAIAKDPMYAFRYAKDILTVAFPLGEPAIARYAAHSFWYANEVLKGPFSLGEPEIYQDRYYKSPYEKNVLKGRPWTNTGNIDEAIDLKNLVTHPKKLKTYKTHISAEEAFYRLKKGDKDPVLVKVVAKDPIWATSYAVEILKGPFPLGEPAIAKDADCSLDYARLLNRPWPPGEPVIAKSPLVSRLYAEYILKGPFTLGEPAIAKDPGYAHQYARDVLEKPFPLGEPKIATRAGWSYQYASEILKGPFPLGEPALYHSDYKNEYEKEILKGRPWTGLDQKVDEAIDLKNLVTNPTKLKTYDTHISPQEAYTRLEKGDKDPILLKAVAKSPRYAYYYAKYVLKGPFSLGEPAIAKDPVYAYDYARDVLRGPFPLGEPAITKKPFYAYRYAIDVLKGPFPLGEPEIAKNPHIAYYYASYALNGPFSLGEPAIAKNDFWKQRYQEYVLRGIPWTGLDQKVDESLDLKNLVSDPKKLKTYDTHISAEEAYNRLKKGDKDPILVKIVAKSTKYTFLYAKNILQGPFPLGEPAIAKDPDRAYYYAKWVLKGPFTLGEPAIAADNWYSFHYAKDVLKGPFPLGEPAIAKDPELAYDYARYVLKGPFTLGEPAIAKSSKYSCYYAQDILKSPFPLGEPVIATSPEYAREYARFVLKGRSWTNTGNIDEAIDLKSLVSDPTKLKTHDTHISPKEAYTRLKNGETDEYLFHAIAKDPELAYDYAILILRKPFPLGEPAIAKDSAFAYLYSRHVLKRPFPLGEPAIATNDYWKQRYQEVVLKGRPWTGLNQKVDEANIQESASGYIPSKKEANDPRYSMALTVDIKPDTMQQNAKKLGWKISRKGTPPLLMKPKT
jgi:hypothetical protein